MPKEGGIFYYSQSQDFNPLPALTSPCKICSSISCNKWLCFTPTSTLLRHLQGHFSDPCFHALLVLSRFCLAWVVASRDKLDLGVLRRAIALVQRFFFCFFPSARFLIAQHVRFFFPGWIWVWRLQFVLCAVRFHVSRAWVLNWIPYCFPVLLSALPSTFLTLSISKPVPLFWFFSAPPSLPHVLSLSLSLDLVGSLQWKESRRAEQQRGFFWDRCQFQTKGTKNKKKRKKSVIDPNDRGKSGVFKELICSN